MLWAQPRGDGGCEYLTGAVGKRASKAGSVTKRNES